MDVDMRVRLRASNREWLTALNAKVQMWLWMPNWKEVVALNAGTEKKWWLRALNRKWWWLWTPRLRRNSGSERQSWEVIMALNAETEKWWRLWTLRLRRNSGSERRNWEVMMALNAKTEKWWWLWTPKLRRNSGSERQSWEVVMALNDEWKMLMALNA